MEYQASPPQVSAIFDNHMEQHDMEYLPLISTDLKFCIGQMRMFYNFRAIENKRTYKLLEDYETSLKYWLEKKIIRFNNICLKADFNKLAGGLKTTCNRDYHSKALEVDRFYNENKAYCFVSDRLTKTGRKIDIRFKNKLNKNN